ncbi:MAG TPA: hypothetical protein VK698_28350 [Kofleriaceae bacterium]|nr:hypothetical protein [Kofleriaceae bacterium]
MRPVLILVVLVTVAALMPGLGAADPPHAGSRETSRQEVQAIEKVVRDFQVALRTKNTRLLSSLMLDSNIVFASPVPPDITQKARETVDVNFTGLPSGGFARFAALIQQSKGIEEKFYNVKITQDANLAVVMFDFEFVEGGAIKNRGMEVWQLMKTTAGWKILSVVWTSKGPPRPQ